MSHDVCIYHGPGCMDGLVAAWAIWKRWPDIQFIPAQYGLAPPDVTGKHVLIVDFSYKRPVLEEMAQTAASITILDHHLSAFNDIGQVPKAAQVPLSNGAYAWVDEADLHLVAQYSWSEAQHGGAVAYMGGGRDAQELRYMHQLILPPKDGLITDHRSRDSLDNRRINLRYATKAQNGANMDRGSGAFKGIKAHHRKWAAQIAVGGENRYLGLFDTPEAAAQAYDAAARAEWGEYARTNFGQIEPLPPTVTALFDMERSGARLAWQYAHPGQDVPPIVLHAEDRDLWRFNMQGTREVHAFLTSQPETFESVDEVATLVELAAGEVLMGGSSILRQHDKDVARLIDVAMMYREISGVEVPVVNAPPWMASDVGNVLAVGYPFAAAFYQTAAGRWSFSLRSAPDGIDVSEIAARFGGGGHKHAAGFTVDTLLWDPI